MDLAFFERAAECGFAVEKLLEKVMAKAMFEVDRGVSAAVSFVGERGVGEG